MRERLAKVVAGAITALLVLLAAFFAQRNQGAAGGGPRTSGGGVEVAGIPPTAALDPAVVARGRAVYEELACARCHSIGDRGNPRAPLDGVGARHPPDELRARVTGTGRIRAELPGSAQRAKDGFGRLPGEDLDALVTYLSSLR